MSTNASLTNVPVLPEGLRGPVEPWAIVPIWQWLAIAAVILLVLGLAAAAFLLWRRARQRRLHPPIEPPPAIPAHVRARQQLEGALRFLDDPNRFCTEVSWILRSYLEERFGWNAPDRTTEEFLRDLHAHEELSEMHRTLLADFLTRCDMVKFARHDPTEAELRDLHRSALRLVDDTVPPPPPSNSEGTRRPSLPVGS